MNELQIIGATSDEPTISGRELHAKLEIDTPYHKWFPRMCEYGFTDGVDFNTDKNVRVQKEGDREVSREVTDHQLTIDMAKEICMLQRSEQGKAVRRYLLDLEKQWNTPEAVMSRALRMADAKLAELNGKMTLLEAENKALLPKAEYHDEVLNKPGLICTSTIAKDLGLSSAAKLNKMLNDHNVIYRDGSGTWKTYAEYEYLMTDGYADYQSYTGANTKPTLKWTEKGRKWLSEKVQVWA